MAENDTVRNLKGEAFEVILKPATPNAKLPTPKSSPRQVQLSKDDINKKLLDAEQRRKVVENEKLLKIAKFQERGEGAREKVQELNNSFQNEAQKSLEAKLEAMEENKNAQIRSLQNRLREHIKRVEEVKQASENYKHELAERIEKKLEIANENREMQLKNMLDRLKEHEQRVQEVLDSSAQAEQEKKEKLIQKMNDVLQNKTNMVKQMLDKLKDHDKHVDEIRQKVQLLRSNSVLEENKEN